MSIAWCKCGLAGTIFFAWTDEWFTGGQEITDWAFGLVTRDRRAEESRFIVLREKLGQDNAALPHRPLPSYPFVSIIVCSYNGAKTLADCLESLGKIDYPNYEIILVDDGSTDNTRRDRRRSFPNVRYIHQTNHGLSHARNTGAAAAKGEIFAYTDSDCMADPDWLYYLIGTLLERRITPASAGRTFRRRRRTGSRPASPPRRAARATSCSPTPWPNTFPAVTWPFIAGRSKASAASIRNIARPGDDVDFCWRLQQAGHVIAFSPTAIVWHYRRFTLQRLPQTTGRLRRSGIAAALQAPDFLRPNRHGEMARPDLRHAALQLVHQPADHLPRRLRRRAFPIDLSDAAIGSRGLSQQRRMVRAHRLPFRAGNLSAGTAHRALPDVWRHLLRRALLHAARADRAEVRHRRARACSSCSSPSCSRSSAAGRAISPGSISSAPRAPSSARTNICRPARSSPAACAAAFTGAKRAKTAIICSARSSRLLEEEGWRYSTDTGWNEWDVQIYGNFWWSITLQTVTEYHGGPKCLTRAGLRYRFVPTTICHQSRDALPAGLPSIARRPSRYLAARGLFLFHSLSG